MTEGDVKLFKYDAFEVIDLITGGPPCQPFSMGGKHGGFLDERDMFPQAVRAVREVRPRAFVFENVQGLTRAAFFDYSDYILLQLELPSLTAKPKEQWGRPLSPLAQVEEQAGRRQRVPGHVQLVNAANYGVPQKRRHAIVVAMGVRGILGAAQGGHASPAAPARGRRDQMPSTSPSA